VSELKLWNVHSKKRTNPIFENMTINARLEGGFFLAAVSRGPVIGASSTGEITQDDGPCRGRPHVAAYLGSK
jgi:hypothetical protein